LPYVVLQFPPLHQKAENPIGGSGDPQALGALLPLVYDSLRDMAERELRRDRPEHARTPTALAHEAYLRLVQLDRISWRSRAHFLGACAQIMRRLLVDHARTREPEKRRPENAVLATEEVVIAAATRPSDLLALHQALEQLEQLDERQARVVEFRFFAGMEIDEVAEVLGVSPAMVKRDWMAARAWLNRELPP
jgi:RNA polymerase sigma-70 factor, ECF subfamily